MDAYLDEIKEFAQKLEVVGSPIGEDELIFHTLRGLKTGFKGFKSAIRTRGDNITFEELVTMLKGKAIEMMNEENEDTGVPNNTYVLVATHSSSSTQSQTPVLVLSDSTNQPLQFNVPVQPQYYAAQQFAEPVNRGFNRGKG